MLYRARILFVAAVALAAIILATQFPIGELVHARAAVASASGQLAKIRSENRSLANDVRDLQKGSTIQQLAHQEYGLVEPGQRSVVIMPGSGSSASVRDHGSTAASAPLGSTTIPKSDIVPTDSLLAPASAGVSGGGGGGGSGGSYWGRVLNRLEFWKASP